MAIAYPVNLGTGGAVTCDFYVVPSCNDPDGDCTPDSTPPPTTDDDDDSGTVQTVSTLPSTGSGASVDAASADWQTPLAALAAALALGAALTIQPARRRS